MNQVAQLAHPIEGPVSDPVPSVAPPAPTTASETGLELGFLVDLMLKTIYRTNAERPSEIATAMCLPVGIIAELIEEAGTMKLMETLGQLGASLTAEMRYGRIVREV